MQSRNSASLFVAKTEEIESGSNPVSLNMSLIIRVNITFDAVWFIGLLGIVLSDDGLSTQPHTIFRMLMNSSAFLQIIGCFIISTDEYSWKWDSFLSGVTLPEIVQAPIIIYFFTSSNNHEVDSFTLPLFNITAIVSCSEEKIHCHRSLNKCFQLCINL